uniref:Arginine vasopressin-induced protein 1 n=1 Tax=Oncorhynchus kisutch TaxID=8019 RepID=A0A8C7JW56_ONCKI
MKMKVMEDPEHPSVEEGPSLLWQPEKRRSRKSGCSNIFAGVNLRQLRRLFHVAGDRDAEERKELGTDGEIEREMETRSRVFGLASTDRSAQIL